MGKGEIARNEQFLLFPQCFVLKQGIVSRFVHIFDIISLFPAEFEDPKIGICGKGLKCNSSPDKHVFLYLFPDSLCIIIHFSAYLTTIRTRVLCLFAQVCKRKNPISEPSLDLAVILVTSCYEDNTLPVNSEQ